MNVTPKAGQVWECTDLHPYWDQTTVLSNIDDRVNYKIGGISINSGIDDFLQDHKFIPQSDLEWLAVTLDCWYCTADYLRNGSGSPFICNADHPDAISRQQWQNTRYELGLDEKPKRIDFLAFAMGLGVSAPININCPCTMTPLKKDTKMIDLSNAKVGDEYNCKDGQLAKLVALKHGTNYVFDIVGDLCFIITTAGGLCVIKDTDDNYMAHLNIVSKHDPRHWLSQLPDAGLFELYKTRHIQCDNQGRWYANDGSWLNNDMMPKLTGDEWRDSKISIVNLRTWQVANKYGKGGPIKPGTAYIVGERGGPDVPVPAGPIATDVEQFNSSCKEQK